MHLYPLILIGNKIADVYSFSLRQIGIRILFFENRTQHPLFQRAELCAPVAYQLETFAGFRAHLEGIPMPAGSPIAPRGKRSIVEILPLLQYFTDLVFMTFPEKGDRTSPLAGLDIGQFLSDESLDQLQSICLILSLLF
jgi:hypothetical protein